MMKFVLGLGIGFTAGLLLAPASGEETRRRLRGQFEDAVNESEQKVNETVHDIADRSAESVGDIDERPRRQTPEVASPVRRTG